MTAGKEVKKAAQPIRTHVSQFGFSIALKSNNA
jgi:hypothetical protein